ncbi:MAG: extensin family protein [Pseudomonas sp.]|uniref:extensin-like domain-containing protein n=1 Tax=Pseudomonas sp. TaxID=306 RepID=UPI0033927B32
MRRLTVLLLLTLLLVAALAHWRGIWAVAPQWNPWAPLDVRLPPNLLTGFKLMRLGRDPALCTQALATSSLRYTPLPDSAPTARCPLRNSLRLQSADLAFSSSFIASCPLAVAFALFEQHELQPAAQAAFGQPVRQLEHFGSFACRAIAGSARTSQHASANALDIAGFRLADGQRITLARDWQGDERAARFLRQVHAGACRSFNITLGPAYNAAHRDHLHVDMGGWRLCH